MRKWFIPLLVTFSMLWQSMAMAHVGAVFPSAAEWVHSVLHWEAVNHHHHEDGSWHVDDSAESTHHMMCDHLSNPVALPQSVVRTQVQGAQMIALSVVRLGLPSPHLESPLRPPRLI